jgi:hypothetical protein
MDKPVDDLVFSKRLRKPKGELSLFKEDARFIRLPLPTPNSSIETANDLIAVQGATFYRGEGMAKSIKKHDKDPAFAVKTYMDLFGLKYDQAYIDDLLLESAIIIKEQKNKFNRPRPEQLAPYFGVQFEGVKSTTAKTPSYPSGHSAQSRLIAEVYARKYPQHRNNLIKAAEECGTGRIMGGLHYPSDHKAGVYLAKRLVQALKPTQKVQYDQHFDLTTTHRRK